MKRILLASMLLAALMLGCISVQQPPQAAPSQSATATTYASASASPSVAPSPTAPLAADRVLVADPIYLGALKPLAKAGAEVRIKVTVKGNALQFEDFFNADVTASSRQITNLSQPSTVAFNIIANGTDLYDGSIIIETDLPARNASTSFAFVDMYATENVYQKTGQRAEVAGYAAAGKPLELNYSKVPAGDGFVTFMIFFPTSSAEPSQAQFEKFFAENKGGKSVRFLHKTPLGTTLIAEIKLLFE